MVFFLQAHQRQSYETEGIIYFWFQVLLNVKCSMSFISVLISALLNSFVLLAAWAFW